MGSALMEMVKLLLLGREIWQKFLLKCGANTESILWCWRNWVEKVSAKKIDLTPARECTQTGDFEQCRWVDSRGEWILWCWGLYLRNRDRVWISFHSITRFKAEIESIAKWSRTRLEIGCYHLPQR